MATAPIISSVVITPSTVNADQSFKIEVVAEAWELTTPVDYPKLDKLIL